MKGSALLVLQPCLELENEAAWTQAPWATVLGSQSLLPSFTETDQEIRKEGLYA